MPDKNCTGKYICQHYNTNNFEIFQATISDVKKGLHFATHRKKKSKLALDIKLIIDITMVRASPLPFKPESGDT